MSGRSQVSDAVVLGIGVTVGGQHVPLEEIYVTKEMPTYVCHQKVRALEIRAIGPYSTDATGELQREIIFADPDFESIHVAAEMFTRYVPMPGDYYVVTRYVPMPGDYYVVYKDGYASFSPRKEFLDGYASEPEPSKSPSLQEKLNDIANLKAGEMLPDWVYQEDRTWGVPLSRMCREAFITINSLKQQIAQQKAEIALAWERVEEVKNEKADPDQSE